MASRAIMCSSVNVDLSKVFCSPVRKGNKTVLAKGLHTNKNTHIMTKKFVEVDGKKVEADDAGVAIKNDKGEHIPFVENADDKGKGADDKGDGIADKTLEQLAETNPAVAELLKQKLEADKKLSDQEAEASKKRQEALEKSGEWEKLAKEREAEITRLQGEDKKKSELLGKYQGSVQSILTETLKTIPKDKLGLIPEDFSPRQKLEYITKNAKLLGASVAGGKGDKIEKGDGEPNLNDEQTLRKELQELIDKGSKRTASEDNLMTEKSRKIKELQTARQAKK